MVTVFKENLNLQLPLIFYNSIRFLFDDLFQNKLQRTGLGRCQRLVTFIAKFNVFSYMILQFRLKKVWKISKPYCMTLKTVARQFCLTGLYHKSWRLTFRNQKRFKDKAQCLLSPPTKYGRTFFVKKLCMGNKLFGGKSKWDVLHGD